MCSLESTFLCIPPCLRTSRGRTAWPTSHMTTYMVDVPDVVARAVERVARRFGVDPEALIAEAIRALPEFQEEMCHQMALVESVTNSAFMTGDDNVGTGS